MINVLNPAIPLRRVELLATWCNEHATDSLRMLDVAVSLALAELLRKEGVSGFELDRERYDKCRQMADKIGRFLHEQCVNDQQRLLGVTFLLKAMLDPLFGKGE